MGYRLAGHGLFVVVLLGSCSLWPSAAVLAQDIEISESVFWAQRPSVIGRQDEGHESRGLSHLSRTLLETAALATNQIDNPRDKAPRLIALSHTYAQFDEQASAVELLDQAFGVILETPEANLRLFELYSYTFSLAGIVPLDDLEASFDRIFAAADPLTAREVQQLKISAIAAGHAYVGEYNRSTELSNQIEEPQIQTLIQHLIRQISLQTAGDVAWIEDSTAFNPRTYPPSEEEVVRPPSLRLAELSFAVFRQQDNPLFDFEANIAERLDLITVLSHPAERASAYTKISRDLAKRNQAERAVEYLDLAYQALAQVADDAANGQAHYPWNWSPEQELIQIGRVWIRAGYLDRGLAEIRAIDNQPALVFDKILALIYAAEQIASTSPVSSESIELANELLIESKALVAFIPSNTEGVEYLLQLAIEYHETGSSDYARSLSQRLQTLYENGTLFEVVEDSYDFLFRWSPLLTELGEFELAAQVAIENEDISQLMRIPAALVVANQEAQARELLTKILPLSARAEAIAQMALAYESLGRSDIAFTTMSQALEISQIEDLSHESSDNSQRLQRGLDNTPLLTINLMRWYINAAGVEQAKRLLLQVENDNVRIPILIQLFPTEEVLQSLHSNDSPTFDDRTLLALAMRAFSEENFYSAIVAAAAIEESPHWQADILIKTATQYADTSHSVEAETELLIQEIADRYR